MSAELQSSSPSGRFKVFADPWEPRMSLWVYPPEIIDAETQDRILKFADPNWSLEFAEWESESIVRLLLSKYPGDRLPRGIPVQIDCALRCAVIGDSRFQLCEIEAVLESALSSQ